MPWLPLFEGPVLSTHRGRLILDPRKAADVIVLRCSLAEHSQHFPAPDPSWLSSHLIDTINNANIEPRAVHTTTLHRLLLAQRHPPGYGGVVCPYCQMS